MPRRLAILVLALLALVAAPGAHAATLHTWGTGQQADPKGSIVALDCPRSDLCVGIDTSQQIVNTSDPFAPLWGSIGIGSEGPVSGLSCTPDPFCVVTQAGSILATNDPHGGLD